jgi:pimeloyl-ACP methyl ester carboxylesterase
MVPALLAALAVATPPPVEGLWAKVSPPRTPKNRVVVLVPGLFLNPLDAELSAKPVFRRWQQPDSELVKALAADSDVYAFTYNQVAPLEATATACGLGKRVRDLRLRGYSEVVLVGHSAGGLLARHLVEDEPKCGVDRLIQVAAPNTGSPLAALKTAKAVQRPFLSSLGLDHRRALLKKRDELLVPERVEMACVVCRWLAGCDGIVSLSSQYSECLQKQGVPAFRVRAGHSSAMSDDDVIRLVATLAKGPIPRLKR